MTQHSDRRLRVNGVGRDLRGRADARTLNVHFNREFSDDEMRELRDSFTEMVRLLGVDMPRLGDALAQPAPAPVVVTDVMVGRLADLLKPRGGYSCMHRQAIEEIAREYLTAALGARTQTTQERLDTARELLAGMDFVVRHKADDPLALQRQHDALVADLELLIVDLKAEASCAPNGHTFGQQAANNRAGRCADELTAILAKHKRSAT